MIVGSAHSLSKGIAKLRRALHDAAVRPQQRKALAWRGYRLIAQVELVGEAMPAGTAPLRLILPGRAARLSDGKHLIGRNPGATLYLDLPHVSRRHALITVRGQIATITDLKSKNGTFVNGKRVTDSVVLSNGDRIQVGSTVVAFESGDTGAPIRSRAVRSRV